MFQLDTEHRWFLYADRPLGGDWPSHVSVRQFSGHQPLMSLARTQFTFSAWCARDQLDVYWSPRHHLPLFANVPCVVTIHDLVWKEFPETMQPANLFVEKLLMPSSVEKAASVIAVSQSTKQEVESTFDIEPERVRLIHEAADLESNQNSSREIPEPYFLFVGTHEPRKNLPRLLEAYQQYLSDGGSHRLMIVGGTGWGDELDSHRIEGVRNLGYVEDFRLDGLIRNSTALILPSLYEGFGLPILESLKRGVPVITSKVASMPEIAGPAGLLIDPYSVTEIASAMTQMSNVTFRDRLAAECEGQSDKFSWDRAAQETLAVIENAAN